MMPSSEDLLFTVFQLCAQTQDITRLSGTVAYVCMTNSILIFLVYFLPPVCNFKDYKNGDCVFR